LSWPTKKTVVLDLNTNIKKNEARGKEKLTGKQIVAKFIKLGKLFKFMT
jgi:hypothetical protein